MRLSTAIFVSVQLICVCSLGQEKEAAPDGLTLAWKEYFRRADVAYDDAIETLKTRISDLEVEIRGEKVPRQKAMLKIQLIAVERALDEAKMTKPNAFFSGHPGVGDYGVVPKGFVAAVIDDHTAIIEFKHDIKCSPMVLNLHDTKALKAKSLFISKEVWQVTDIETDDMRIERVIGRREFVVISQVKKGVVEKNRALYEAEKKAKGAKED
jgi:hypothetical protein